MNEHDKPRSQEQKKMPDPTVTPTNEAVEIIKFLWAPVIMVIGALAAWVRRGDMRRIESLEKTVKEQGDTISSHNVTLAKIETGMVTKNELRSVMAEFMTPINAELKSVNGHIQEVNLTLASNGIHSNSG